MNDPSGPNKYERMTGPMIPVGIAAVIGVGCLLAAAADGLETNFVCSADGPNSAGNCVGDPRGWFERNPAPWGLALATAVAAAMLCAIELARRRSAHATSAARRLYATQVTGRIGRGPTADEGAARSVGWVVHVRNVGPSAVHNVRVTGRDRSTGRRTLDVQAGRLEAEQAIHAPLTDAFAESTHDVSVQFTDAAGVRWVLNAASGGLHEISGAGRSS